MNFSEFQKNELPCVRLCGMIEVRKTEWEGDGTVEKIRCVLVGVGSFRKKSGDIPRPGWFEDW